MTDLLCDLIVRGDCAFEFARCNGCCRRRLEAIDDEVGVWCRILVLARL
jgi:hypothetical protein